MTTLSANGRRIGYMRVSTPDQRLDRQCIGLQESCDELYLEQLSAVAGRRPVFDEALSRLNAGDTFVVWDLDRAFRSTLDAILTAESLKARKVGMHIMSLNIDTSTPEGELFYTIIAAYAQFERRILRRRTCEGIMAARMRGAQIGRPRRLSDKIVADAHCYIGETGYPPPYVAALLRVSPVTLERGFRRLGLVSHPCERIQGATSSVIEDWCRGSALGAVDDSQRDAR
ncbi:MAG: recombinase family protein [Thermomicrobiales bacterium]|jgi:DNA invertase Pin-like site-specific DNA recombinase